MDDVRLPELTTIQKYSIAVRAEYAPAEEVIAALKDDLETLTGSTKKRAAPRKKTSRSTARKRT